MMRVAFFITRGRKTKKWQLRQTRDKGAFCSTVMPPLRNRSFPPQRTEHRIGNKKKKESIKVWTVLNQVFLTDTKVATM